MSYSVLPYSKSLVNHAQTICCYNCLEGVLNTLSPQATLNNWYQHAQTKNIKV